MLSGFVPKRFTVWKLKIPLKIKIFLWYLGKGVTLIKDNLIKRKWKGNSLCCFFNNTETIQHLFFDCHAAKFVWNSIYFTFGIQPPSNITDMLGPWLGGLPHKFRKQLLIGVIAFCWAIWLTRNDAVFS